jgi:hypothetical protein
MQQLLPLAHHAHVLVVEDEDLDRQRSMLHRVDSSCMFISIEASPLTSTPARPGCAICTPIAAGRP